MRTRLVVSLLQACLCVAFLSAATYAWVSRNDNTASDGMQMEMDAQSMSISNYDVYKYNSETNEVDNITSDDTVYELEAYDSIFTERNVNTPLLLVVKLKGFSTNASYIDFSINCVETHTDMTEDYTSNIICVKYATESAINAYASSAGLAPVGAGSSNGDLYYTATAYFKTVAQQQQFAQAVQNGHTYDYTGTKAVQLDCSVALTAQEKAAQEAVLCFIIDYEPDLVEAQHINNFSNIQLQLGSAINFRNDIKLISFSSR